jgi:hypothetical protein
MAPAAAEPARTSRREGVFFETKVKGLFWGSIGIMFVALSARNEAAICRTPVRAGTSL